MVYGSPRQLGLLDGTVTARAPGMAVAAAARAADAARRTAGDVHVVASGDPMLHGIGATLIRLFGADRVRVLPHVSSVTLACARLGWPVQDTEVISLVTAEPHTAVRRGGQRRRAVPRRRQPGRAGRGCSPKPAAATPS